MATLRAQQGSAQAQVNDILDQDAAKGRVAVHSFNPDASPQEKAAAAGKGRDKLKSVKDQPEASGRGVAVDTGNSNVVPTISVHDADSDAKPPSNGAAVKPAEPAGPALPGAMPDGPAPAIPEWYKVGWRSVAGIDAPVLEEGEERDKGVLDLFLAEQFYGDWYHNAALVVVVVFVSYFMARFQLGFGWIFILLAFANTYYSSSMERVRRRARDDIQRELVKTRLPTEDETADWINHFLDRFWLIYEPVLSRAVISSVDQVLSANTPPFLDSLRLGTFTLGTKAPRIDKVRTFPKTPDDIVMMDWGLSFTPNDISDMTPRQAATKVNPKIVLSVRVGKGLATASMPILLEDITFTAFMRIRLKLMTNFPHVQVVDLSFMEPPVIDYVLKPVGGETFGFDINHIPGLSAFIRSLTHGTLGPMMYWPNVFTLNLEQLLSGAPLDAAIGVLQVTIQSARGIKGSKVGGGSPDPFVTLSINNRVELARTKYRHNTFNPNWMETKFILLNNLTESLVLSVYDYNDHRKNTLLGAASFELPALLEDATQEGLERPILKDGKERGTLRFDISFYPVLKPEAGSNGEEIMQDTSVGIVRLTLHQAKDLDSTKSLSGDLNPLAKVFIGGSNAPIHVTSLFKHTNNPVWESPTEFLCSDRASSIITIKVIDDRDFLKDPVVGYMSIKLEDLLEAKKEAGRDWWPLSGCKSGKVRLSVEWKPLNMAGSLHGADQYVPPIGVVRLHLFKATDVKNVEAALGGKSDPYMRVQVNNVTKGKTEVVNNNLNPVWDQILYIPVHSLRETMLMECMDYQHLTKDRSLGSAELRVSDLAKESSDPKHPFESTGKKTAAEPLQLGGGNAHKGQVHYVAEFVPALPVHFEKFEKGGNEMQRAAAGADGDDGGSVAEDGSSASSSEEDHQAVPQGVTTRAPIGASKDHTKDAKSTDTSVSAGDQGTSISNGNGTNGDPKPKEDEGVHMKKEDLLRHQSGIIIFNVVSGNLHRKARLQVLLDDGYWPAFSTTKSRSTNAQWEFVGEGFIKELDFGRVWLRLDENDDDERDDIIGEWKGDTKTFLEETLDHVRTFKLVDSDGRESTVEIEARYIPVPVRLEPRESVNNQGLLHIDLVDGHNIPGADRGGKSDPYAVFTINGEKVFKSQTKKKTLSPEWNESFEVQVPSRVGADFSVEIFDWNQIEQAKSLGSARIDLASLEPFQATERSLTLHSTKHGDKGSVRIRMVFRPEILVKSRKNTHATFQSAGKTMTQIGILPVTAGKGVLQGVTGVFRKEKDFAKEANGNDVQAVPDVATGQASHPVGQPDSVGGMGSATFPSLTPPSGSPGEGSKTVPGTLRVTVIDAKDLTQHDVKPYVLMRVGDKEVKTKAGKTETPEWNESFNFSAGSLTQKIFLWVYDHKTLAKDKVLSEGEVDIWRHIEHDKTSSADVTAEFRDGQGIIRLRLEFDPDVNPSGLVRGASTASFERASTHGSPMKFSIRGRKSVDAGKS